MGFAQVPPAAITRVLASFDRQQLEGFVAVAIDLMDLNDGDPDTEANGDDQDGTGSAEEDPWMEPHAFRGMEYGAGCPLSDVELNGDEGDYGGEVDGI